MDSVRNVTDNLIKSVKRKFKKLEVKIDGNLNVD